MSAHEPSAAADGGPPFLGVPQETADASFAVIPRSLRPDEPWRKGPIAGPPPCSRRVRRSSSSTCRPASSRIAGIETLPAILHEGGPETLADLVEARVEEQMALGRIPVVIGGEHSVSIGAFRAAAARFGDRDERIGVVQIDAQGTPGRPTRGRPATTPA